MRILLVRPPVPPHTVGLKHIMICEPIELEYVAAGLKGHEVQIMDLILERGLEHRLATFRPDVVGTSSYINGVNEVKKICRTAKRWDASCHTVVGGAHASLQPESFVDDAVDCIVKGDGTTIIQEVVESLDDPEVLEALPGLVLPQKNAAPIHTPEEKWYMPHPDTLPFPRRDLVAHLRNRYYYLLHQPVALMKTTWGCWYKCNFCCTWEITGGTPFARSPESIADELETIECEDVYIVDDIFLINPKRLRKLAALLRERGIRKKYLVYGRADFICEHEDLIAEWASLGLRSVIVGLEATTDGELDSMNKQTTVNQNVRAIEVLRRHGVDTYGSFVVDPGYTPEDWTRLQQFIDDNDLYYLNLSPMTPLPGTAKWEEYKNQLSVPPSAHGLWDLTHAVIPTRMPLKHFYRSLLRTYARTIFNLRRARRVILDERAPVWSWKYLRMWWGSFKIFFQFLRLHRHHDQSSLEQAMEKGEPIA